MSGTILESGASRVPESVEPVTVVGAGLAGSECAWQLAERGIPVTLCEMRPERYTPAHHTPDFAELVCSNSLRSDELSNAVGLLKAEMRRMNSLVMRSADHNRVAAGGALAVDRTAFSREITEALEQHPLVTVVRKEVTEIPDGITVIASGPLSSDAITRRITELCPEFDLHFYDAVIRPLSASWSPPKRRRFTASTTAACLKAVCRWKGWPAAGKTLFATVR